MSGGVDFKTLPLLEKLGAVISENGLYIYACILYFHFLWLMLFVFGL